MRKAKLRTMEETKYKEIKKLVDNNGNKKRVALKLNISLRQVNRLINVYKTKGIYGFIHGNRDRKPSNTISDETKDLILKLYQEKYYDANLTHFTKLLRENENINVSYSLVYKLLRTNNILSPKVQKATVKYEKKKIQEAKKNKEKLTEGQKDLIVKKNILDVYDSHSRVERLKYFGECLEMDASKDYWFNDVKTTLHGAIDNATGTVCGLYFDKEETLNGYYHLFEIIWRNYGVPAKFLTDNRTVFIYNGLKEKSLDKDTLTQFGYACKNLGVDLETTSVPEKKSRIERLWGTLQSRLMVELRLAEVKTIEEANEFLRIYTTKFNEEFALPIDYTTSVFEKIDTNKINETLCIISKRKFDRGCAIKYKNNYYLAFNDDKQINYCKGTECLVIQTYDNRLLCNVNDYLSELYILADHKKYSETFDSEKPTKEKKGKYIPPITHPWKIDFFKKYIHSIKAYENYANN